LASFKKLAPHTTGQSGVMVFLFPFIFYLFLLPLTFDLSALLARRSFSAGGSLQLSALLTSDLSKSAI
jgi:hypothetical protein